MRVCVFLVALLLSFSVALAVEDCTNNIDDDLDGFADCRDTECYFPTPQDCAGSTVSGKAQGIGSTHCTDGSPFYSSGQSRCCTTDKYWDGASCAFPPEDCSNGVSDDGDASIDVADSDCLLDYPYSESDLLLWNCTGTFQDYEYCSNAGSPRIECFDFYDTWTYRYCSQSGSFGASCALSQNLVWNGTHYECQPALEDCSNGVDDDSDGLVDCADDECRVTSTITPLELGYYDCGNNGQSEHGPGGQGYYCSQDKDLSETYLCCQNGYEAINNAGLWTCTIKNPGVELCSDGIDNDGNGFTDCQDPECIIEDKVIRDSDLPDYNCLNTYQTNEFCFNNPTTCNYTGSRPPETVPYYCSDGETFNELTEEYGVNICCPVGSRANRNFMGVWICVNPEPCYPNPPYSCNYDYNKPEEFLLWLQNGDCLDPYSIPATACCPVIKYGEFDYYSNTDNVKVY